MRTATRRWVGNSHPAYAPVVVSRKGESSSTVPALGDPGVFGVGLAVAVAFDARTFAGVGAGSMAGGVWTSDAGRLVRIARTLSWSAFDFRLWHVVQSACRFAQLSSPPIILGVMWSTDVAGAPHAWQVSWSRFSIFALMRFHWPRVASSSRTDAISCSFRW